MICKVHVGCVILNREQNLRMLNAVLQILRQQRLRTLLHGSVTALIRIFAFT